MTIEEYLKKYQISYEEVSIFDFIKNQHSKREFALTPQGLIDNQESYISFEISYMGNRGYYHSSSTERTRSEVNTNQHRIDWTTFKSFNDIFKKTEKHMELLGHAYNDVKITKFNNLVGQGISLPITGAEKLYRLIDLDSLFFVKVNPAELEPEDLVMRQTKLYKFGRYDERNPGVISLSGEYVPISELQILISDQYNNSSDEFKLLNDNKNRGLLSPYTVSSETSINVFWKPIKEALLYKVELYSHLDQYNRYSVTLSKTFLLDRNVYMCIINDIIPLVKHYIKVIAEDKNGKVVSQSLAMQIIKNKISFENIQLRYETNIAFKDHFGF